MHCDNIDKTAGWQLADVSKDNEADIYPVLIEVVVFNALAQPTKINALPPFIHLSGRNPKLTFDPIESESSLTKWCRPSSS